MKALIPYVKMAFAERRDMLLSILTGFIAGIAAVSLFSASGLLISRAALTPPIYTLMVIVAIVKLLGVTAAISRYGERYFSHRATFTMLSNIRLRVYEKLEPVASRVLSKIQSGDLMSRIVGDVESLQHVLLRVIYPPVVMLTVFIATITFTFTLSFGSAVVILAGFVLVLVVIPTLFFIGHRRVDSKLRQTRGSFHPKQPSFFLASKNSSFMALPSNTNMLFTKKLLRMNGRKSSPSECTFGVSPPLDFSHSSSLLACSRSLGFKSQKEISPAHCLPCFS
ncbi:hypothetical protein [Geomicrobium sp. JCM 19039]|uniref:hypothetical protein n=1 Tax=Geomicrobium sp. JCM 19039 TaxID=1460636 RepID=UPI000B055374|nr:hypothetical protein [Geomicrobium sp. JCM 19039]